MTRTGMKVVVVAGYAPSLVNFRGPLLRALVARGCTVVAVAPEPDAAVAARLQEWGVAYCAEPLERAGVNPWRDWQYQRRLARLFARLQPDVVLAYTHKPVLYSALAAKKLPRARVYGLITGLGYAFIEGSRPSLKQRLSRTILHGLYRRVAGRWQGMIFQNPDDQQLFQQLGFARPETPQLIVRGSGVELAHYPFQPLPAGRPRFVLIARLLVDKGIREYVEAARLVTARHPEAEFHLVGPLDPNPAAIQLAEIEEWRRAGLIVYHGAMGDVRPFYRDCTAYVLPSYREGTPRTVLEAMASGRAVITTDVPGCRETIFAPMADIGAGGQQGRNGLLVPARNAAALAAAMEHLLTQPSLAATMGRAGRELAEEFYAVEKVNESMLAFMGLPRN